MAIKHLIARGIGFSPGSTKYIVTHGLEPTEAATVRQFIAPGIGFSLGSTKWIFTRGLGDGPDTAAAVAAKQLIAVGFGFNLGTRYIVPRGLGVNGTAKRFIAPGIGFNLGTVKWTLTRGLGDEPNSTIIPKFEGLRRNVGRMMR